MDQLSITNKVSSQSKSVLSLHATNIANLDVISLHSSEQALSWWQCTQSLFSSKRVGPNKMKIVFSYLKNIGYRRW